MIYDILTPEPHPNLSDKAKALAMSEEDGDEEKFLAEGNLAEDHLGFNSIAALTDTGKIALAKMYIALQISWQLELGMDPLYQKSVSSAHTNQLVVYRDGLTTHPYVASRIDNLLGSSGGGYKRTLRSIR